MSYGMWNIVSYGTCGIRCNFNRLAVYDVGSFLCVHLCSQKRHLSRLLTSGNVGNDRIDKKRVYDTTQIV